MYGCTLFRSLADSHLLNSFLCLFKDKWGYVSPGLDSVLNWSIIYCYKRSWTKRIWDILILWTGVKGRNQAATSMAVKVVQLTTCPLWPIGWWCYMWLVWAPGFSSKTFGWCYEYYIHVLNCPWWEYKVLQWVPKKRQSVCKVHLNGYWFFEVGLFEYRNMTIYDCLFNQTERATFSLASISHLTSRQTCSKSEWQQWHV